MRLLWSSSQLVPFKERHIAKDGVVLGDQLSASSTVFVRFHPTSLYQTLLLWA